MIQDLKLKTTRAAAPKVVHFIFATKLQNNFESTKQLVKNF